MPKIRVISKVVISFALIFLLMVGSSAASGSWPDTEPTGLKVLIAESFENNFMLKSLRLQADALFDQVAAAGALDDPRIGFALANLPTDTFRFDQEPMTQKQISITQKIPWFSKLDLKTQLAVLRAKTAEVKWSAERLAIARRVAVTYYELVLVVRSQHINTQLIEKLNRLLQSSESKYASGRGLQQDVLQAQVELGGLLDEKNKLADRRRTADSKLNELLNRSDYAQVSPGEIEMFELPQAPLVSQRLKERALKHNPQIAIRKLKVKQAEIDKELARKDFYPNFDVRFAYGQRDDDQAGNSRADFFTAAVNLNIPLWQKRKQKPKLESAAKRSQAAQHSLKSLQLKLPHNIDALVNTLRHFNANYDLYKNSLLLQAEQWANSAQIAYEVGKLEFNSMISAQIKLLRMKLQADTYLIRYFQKVAELEELLGESD